MQFAPKYIAKCKGIPWTERQCPCASEAIETFSDVLLRCPLVVKVRLDILGVFKILLFSVLIIILS